MEADPYAQLTYDQLANLLRFRGIIGFGQHTINISREQLIDLLRAADQRNQVSPPPSPRQNLVPPNAPRKPMPVPGAPRGANRQPLPLPLPLPVNRPTLPQPLPLPVQTRPQPLQVNRPTMPLPRPVPVAGGQPGPLPVTTRPQPVPVPTQPRPLPVTTRPQPVPVPTQPRPVPILPVTGGLVLPPNVGQKRPVPLPDLTQRLPAPPVVQPVLPPPTTFAPVSPGITFPSPLSPIGSPRSPTLIREPVPETRPPDAEVGAALMRKFALRTAYPMYDVNINPSTPRLGYQMTYDERHNGRMFVRAFEYQYVNGLNVTHRDVTQPTVGYLMANNDSKFTTDLISELGYDRLTDTLAGLYNLLWYLNLAGKDASTLNKWEKSYLSGLNEEQLRQMLGPKYTGPQDKASLLFAAVTGQSTHLPSIENIPRYPEVMTYTPPRVWMLANDLYNIAEEYDQKWYEPIYISPYAPYVHVALQAPSSIEQVIVSTTLDNVNECLRDYQIVLPTQNTPITAQRKLDYFVNEIKNYEYVFTRVPGILPPPVLKGLTQNQVEETLKEYTIKELVDAYEPIKTWRDRKHLIEVIYEEGRGGSVWSWRKKHCNNDDTMNVIEGELHGALNKEDPDDPTLSYGVQKNYRCYQMYELEASFREDDNGIFHFTVPDWIPAAQNGGKEVLDPTTGAPLMREFSVQSMRQLSELLKNPPYGYEVKPLKDKVTAGLEAANSSTVAARKLRQRYEAMTPEEQNIVQVYLGWLFLLGMWMRFWKGPGYPYPVKWVEGGGVGDRCDQGTRDEYVWIQLALRTTLLEIYEKNPTLNDFISNLPLVNYNFQTGEATLAEPGEQTDWYGKVTARPYRINDVVEPLQRGKFCEAHGSDLILKSSYYLINRILNLTTGAEFNNFLNASIDALSTMEKTSVEKQLAGIKDRTKVPKRVEALESRLRELNAPKKAQLPFDPTATGKTGHTDQGLGWQIKFAK